MALSSTVAGAALLGRSLGSIGLGWALVHQAPRAATVGGIRCFSKAAKAASSVSSKPKSKEEPPTVVLGGAAAKKTFFADSQYQGGVRRTGLIATKLGMASLFAPDGNRIPVTLLQVRANQVVQSKTPQIDGYTAVQVGAGERRPWRVTKAMKGHFALGGCTLKQKVVEFRVSPEALLPAGTEIPATHFVPGQLVDVRGVSAGKGFAGGMKRHHFHGQRASHGTSLTHRSLGTTGNHQDPGRVIKGRKMAGHMGAAQRCQQNLKVVQIDATRNIIYVKGAVPGKPGGWNLITDAIRHPDQFKTVPPFPTDLTPEAITYKALPAGQRPVIKAIESFGY